MTPPRPPMPPNGQPPSGPKVVPGMELIQPVPLMFTMWPVPNSGPAGETAIVMRVATPLGPLHFILAADEAIQIGGQLRQQGKAAKSGLTLPPGVRLGEGTDDEETPPVAEHQGDSVIHLPTSLAAPPDEAAAPTLEEPPPIEIPDSWLEEPTAQPPTTPPAE